MTVSTQLTEVQSKAASGFDVTLLTADNVEDWAESMGGPLDMIEEIQEYVKDSGNWAFFFKVGGEELHYCYLSSGRGGVATNGYTDWTDCNNLDDLINRWENYETRWAN